MLLFAAADRRPVTSEAGSPSSPEDLIRATRPVMMATAKLMGAISTGLAARRLSLPGRNEDLTSAANAARKVVVDMYKACRLAAAQVPRRDCAHVQAKTAAPRDKCILAGHRSAVAVRALLDFATLVSVEVKICIGSCQ